MRSVFTDASGKYATAVYYCEITTHNQDFYTDEWIAQLFPRAYGKSVAATSRTTKFQQVRWEMLIANAKQTTVADIKRRILDKGEGLKHHNVHVSVQMALAERGEASPRAATSRAGTRRAMANTPHHVGLTAK